MRWLWGFMHARSFIVPGLRRGASSNAGGGIERDRLDARNEAKALIRLGRGLRRWIGFENYMHLFATNETYLPPSEWDLDGHREVSEFAMAYDCTILVP